MNRLTITVIVVIFALLFVDIDCGGKKKPKKPVEEEEDDEGGDEEDDGGKATRDKFGFMEFEEPADGEEPGADLGKKTCTNEKEIAHCGQVCEEDEFCAYDKQKMYCEGSCLQLCKFIDDNMGSKCVLHMMSRISWYRNPAGKSAKLTRSFATENGNDEKDRRKAERKGSGDVGPPPEAAAPKSESKPNKAGKGPLPGGLGR